MSLVCILIKKQKGETNTNRAVKLFSFRQKKVFPHWGKKNRHEKERAYPHDTGGTHGAQPDCLEHRLTRAVRWPPRIVLGTLPSVPRHCRKALPRTKRCRRMKPQWAGPAKRGPGAASGAAAGSLPLGLASSRLPPGRAVPCRAAGPPEAAGDGRARTPPGREGKRRAPPSPRERLPEAVLVLHLGARRAPPSRRGAAAVRRAGQRSGASPAWPQRRLLSAGGWGTAATFPPPSGRRGPVSLTLPFCETGAASGAPPRPLRDVQAWDGAGGSL